MSIENKSTNTPTKVEKTLSAQERTQQATQILELLNTIKNPSTDVMELIVNFPGAIKNLKENIAQRYTGNGMSAEDLQRLKESTARRQGALVELINEALRYVKIPTQNTDTQFSEEQDTRRSLADQPEIGTKSMVPGLSPEAAALRDGHTFVALLEKLTGDTSTDPEKARKKMLAIDYSKKLKSLLTGYSELLNERDSIKATIERLANLHGEKTDEESRKAILMRKEVLQQKFTKTNLAMLNSERDIIELITGIKNTLFQGTEAYQFEQKLRG